MAKLSVQERLERLREAGRKQSGQGGQQSSPAPAATSGRTTAGMTVRERLNRLKEAGRQQSPSLPTVTSQAAGETAGRKKAGRPTTAGKPGQITSPAREAERRAEELRTLRDEAQQEFLNFRGAEITAGAAGMPTESYAGQRYRTAEEAYRARQDYDRQLAELRNRYYQEENEQQRARLAEDASMQASFARADEIRGALNRIQTLEQTRASRASLVSTRQTLVNSITTYKLQLELMAGGETDGQVQLGALPQVTDQQLQEMDLEADLTAAKEASYDLYEAKLTLDDAKETYNDAGGDGYHNKDNYEWQTANHQWQAAQYTYDAAVQNFEAAFRALYLQVKDCKQVLDAAGTALAVKQSDYAVAQLKQEQGSISQNELLESRDALAEAQDTVDAARDDLFSAYHTYRWAVDRGILNY